MSQVVKETFKQTLYFSNTEEDSRVSRHRGRAKKKIYFSLPDHFSEIRLYPTEHMLAVREVKVILQRQG